jgi:hypothetical protein
MFPAGGRRIDVGATHHPRLFLLTEAGCRQRVLALIDVGPWLLTEAGHRGGIHTPIDLTRGSRP